MDHNLSSMGPEETCKIYVVNSFFAIFRGITARVMFFKFKSNWSETFRK